MGLVGDYEPEFSKEITLGWDGRGADQPGVRDVRSHQAYGRLGEHFSALVHGGVAGHLLYRGGRQAGGFGGAAPAQELVVCQYLGRVEHQYFCPGVGGQEVEGMKLEDECFTRGGRGCDDDILAGSG